MTKLTIVAKSGFFGLMLLVLALGLRGNAHAPDADTRPVTQHAKLKELSRFYSQRLQERRTQLYYDLLKSDALPQRLLNEDPNIQLMYIDERGHPVFYSVDNLNAARTISTDDVWPGGSGGFSLSGSGTALGQLGLWDGRGVLETHQEFGGRVNQEDIPAETHEHSTHVAGTMVAEGVNAAAQGMSFQAALAAYDFDNDEAEMTDAADEGMNVSNHSYGFTRGWRWDGTVWTWHGDISISATEDYLFGFYDVNAQTWDEIAHNAPYYTIVKAAGNDRNDTGPGAGGWHWVWDGGWAGRNDPQADPDGGADGFDCLPQKGTAKNLITVGAVNEIPWGYTGPGDVVMSAFSSWGPTDDGRIKPDVVANGVNVRSCSNAGDALYTTMSGTSMATPGVSGSLNLLVRHYEATHGGLTPLSSTMKAVVIQTADEAGLNPGPDYMFGWGLMNTLTAAELIEADAEYPGVIVEEALADGESDEYSLSSNGIDPIRITLVWADPPGTPPPASLNPTTRMLVNDLDVRLEHQATSTIFRPYVLDANNPANPAGTGDNVLDNVEQIHVAFPPLGDYLVTVSHKGTLTDPQNYSLVISHRTFAPETFSWIVVFDTTGSMSANGRIDSAQSYAVTKISWILDEKPNDMIALGTFAGDATQGDEPFILRINWTDNKNQLIDHIEGLTPSGWTPLADAVCDAAQKFTDPLMPIPRGARRLLLITDGDENSSDGPCAGTPPPDPVPRWHRDPEPNPPWCDDGTPTDMSWHCAVWNTLVGETIVDVAYFGNLGTVKGGSGRIDGASPKGPDEKFLRDLAHSTGGTYYDPTAITTVRIPNTDECVNPGDYVCLPILLDNNTTPLGGFELEVEFDYTSMTFVGAEPGELIEGFEKFTYRLLPCPSCGCCKYKILLFGMYDIPNGVENVGDPIPMSLVGEYKELVSLCFVVNNDENLRGLKIPVCFEWEGEVVNDTLVEDWECGENTFSSWSGDTLFASNLLCQFNPDICDDPADRIQPILIFQDGICGQNCGGIDICPAGPGECKRGDVNFNTLTYEVADAVLFASYFVEGTSVFRYDMAYQICATDVNADGRTLTLSDLVYLIRVILHDAVAIPKLTPSSEVANVIVSGGTISTECAAPIGAILFEFDAAVNPTLLADMEMVAKDNKVLVWSSKGKSFSTGEVLGVDAELVSVTAVDHDSRELTTTITGKVAPPTFALHPAYPNPFNPFTNLSFTLPENVDYSLKIYNVAGQLVRTYEGLGSVGLNMITWDSKDNAGVEVASGVYFYKLTAGGFSATEKMVILK